MKILYAIQGTGNGHLSRALALIPQMKKYADVDILISGTQSDLELPYPVKYRFHGAGFTFGKDGGVDVLKTLTSVKLGRLVMDTLNLPVQDYDLVVSDFEPISAWACKLRGVPCVGISHQAAFLSEETPRPESKSFWAEMVLKYYAPVSNHVGLHFRSYSDNILTPIIRPEIRTARVEDHGHILVYLPSYSAEYLSAFFKVFPRHHFKVYTKEVDRETVADNVEIIKAGSDSWMEDLRTCHGAIVGAGFECPSELLHLGKKMIAVPMSNQYEQQCNAEALSQLGVTVLQDIHPREKSAIDDWLSSAKVIQITYPDHTDDLSREILRAGDVEVSTAEVAVA
jgi:uncharacterized protein (TIGR00661 family)